MPYDLLEKYKEEILFDKLQILRQERLNEVLKISHFDQYLKLLKQFIPPPEQEVKTSYQDLITISASSKWQEDNYQIIRQMLVELLPWRKGPFHFLGQMIDTEWRSEMKWNRFASHLPSLSGRRILDIGCHNGYYMFRTIPEQPEIVVGLDPSSRAYYQFDLFQKVVRSPLLSYDLLGIDDLDVFPDFFDVVLCLGVIYHRKDPYSSCRYLYDCMKPAGTLFIESLIYPGEEPIAYCPEGRYAKMRNVWYLPTVSALKVWLEKAGFIDIEVIDVTATTTHEQRTTELSRYDSLETFLDNNDPTKTVEGLPAPVRAILKAKKA